MGHWKGTKVLVQIWETKGKLVYEEARYLDTDTMDDLFDEYDPSIHDYQISPLEDE